MVLVPIDLPATADGLLALLRTGSTFSESPENTGASPVIGLCIGNADAAADTGTVGNSGTGDFSGPGGLGRS